MQQRDLAGLLDILQSAKQIQANLSHISREEFENNILL